MVEPISLTPEEQKNLRRQQRRALGRLAERIHSVLLFARGYPFRPIATLYQVDERTVSAWRERSRQAGVAGLDDLPRSGRPRLASAAASAEAPRCLDAAPSERGAERTTWTRRLLGRHRGERLGYALSGSRLTRLIARLGLVFRRPKLGLKPVEGATQEREARRAIIGTARALSPEAPHL
jgi:transposase